MSVTTHEMERDLSEEYRQEVEQETLEPGMVEPSAPPLEKLTENELYKGNEYFCVFGIIGETMGKHRNELERQMAREMHRLELQIERRIAEGIRDIGELTSPTPIQSPSPSAPEQGVMHGPENRQSSCWLALWKRLSACKPCCKKDVPHGTVAPISVRP